MPSFRDVIARLRADDKKLTPELRKARSKFKRFGKRVQRDLGRSFSKATGALKAGIGLGGIAGIAAVGRDVIDFEKKLKRLEIQAGSNRGALGDLRGEIDRVSQATGQSRQALLNTSARFLSLTGDAQGAAANLDLFARVATATGSELEDIAGASVAVSKQFNGINPENMEKVFDILIAQGKAGSVELKQVAAELGQLGGTFRAVGRDGIEGVADLGAAFQVIQTEFGFDPAKARTGLNSFLTQLAKPANKKRFKKATGVSLFDAKGARRDVTDVLRDLSSKNIGFEKLIVGLGEAKAARAGAALAKNFEEMERIKKASLEASVVQEDFADFATSSAGRIQRSWNDVKNQIADLFTPERVAKFAELMEKLVRVLEWVIDNVHALAAAWVAAKVTSFGVQFASAASGAMKLGGALGAAAKGFGVLQAAAVGFSIGTALDQWLGLSDAISDSLAGLDAVDARANSAFLRQRATDLGAGFGVEAARNAAQIKTTGKLSARQRQSALTLASEAERAGIVGKDGTINRDVAAKIAAQGLSTKQLGSGQGKQATDDLIKAIELGLATRAEARGQNFAAAVGAADPSKQPLSIVVQGQFRMDQNGLVALENPKVKRDRRGVAQ